MSINSRFERSLRSKPFERPKPLRRGQGCGGGNYRNLQNQHVEGDRPPRSSRTTLRPATLRLPQPSRSGSVSIVNRARVVSPQPGPSGLYLPRTSDLYQPGPSGSDGRQCRPSDDPRTTPTVRTIPERNISTPTTQLSKTTRPRQPTAKRAAARSLSVQSTPSRPSSARPNSARRPESPTIRPSAPGPSCLRDTARSGPKRKIQFSGVPASNAGQSPDSRTRLKPLCNTLDKEAILKYCKNRSNQADTESKGLTGALLRSRSTGGNVQGPSLYPIYPDQYENPLISLPGPKQVLLLPGDINPCETTIIDIVGLDEGDIAEVPGIPPHAPPTLLEDGLKKALEEHEEWMRENLPSYQKEKNLQKRPPPKPLDTGRKKTRKTEAKSWSSCVSHLGLIHQGRSFPYEQFGNCSVFDPNNPPYTGPAADAPDPECQRARPYDPTTRKTTARLLTDEEIQEKKDEILARKIQAVLEDNRAKIARDRLARGLAANDLMNIDADFCEVDGPVCDAPQDIFSYTDRCNIAGSPFQYSPQISPVKHPSPEITECEQELIAWDQDRILPNTQQSPKMDLLTSDPNLIYTSPSRTRSPTMMGMYEPDEDLLCLTTPPRKSPAPCQNDDDLINWSAETRLPLPFDDPLEQALFDIFSGSPTSSGSPFAMKPDEKAQELFECEQDQEKLLDLSISPSGVTRIVRAVPLEDDPTIAVLEDSPLAQRSSPSNGCKTGRELSKGNYTTWQRDTYFQDFRSLQRSPPARSRVTRMPINVSGVSPLEDDENLSILDDAEMQECSGVSPVGTSRSGGMPIDLSRQATASRQPIHGLGGCTSSDDDDLKILDEDGMRYCFGESPERVQRSGRILSNHSPRPAGILRGDDDDLSILDETEMQDCFGASTDRGGTLLNFSPRGPQVSSQPMDISCDDDLGILDAGEMQDDFFASPEGRQMCQRSNHRTSQPLYYEGARGGSTCKANLQFGAGTSRDECTDLLNMSQRPDQGQTRKPTLGRLGSELVGLCQDPIERCDDILGLTVPNQKTPPKRVGQYTKELLEMCPEEQELLDLQDKCSPTDGCPRQSTPSRPHSYRYSRDLFTNVKWNPSMGSPSNQKGDNCH